MTKLFEELQEIDNIDLHRFFEDEYTIGAISRISDHSMALSAVERESVSRAVGKRRREYSTGRFLAKSVLQKIGLTVDSIPADTRRAPCWPTGVVGSISHSNLMAIALVARQTTSAGLDWVGLGVDIEEIARVTPQVAGMTLTDWELGNVVQLPHIKSIYTASFSAKEAIYKAVNPSVGIMIDFKEVELLWGACGTTFKARYVGTNPQNRIMERGQGYICYYRGHVITLFRICPV